jgi:hypothetical protein
MVFAITMIASAQWLAPFFGFHGGFSASASLDCRDPAHAVGARRDGGQPSARRRALADAEINRQAAMIGYVNDFRFMMWLCFAAIPLVLLMKTARRRR